MLAQTGRSDGESARDLPPSDTKQRDQIRFTTPDLIVVLEVRTN